MPLPLDPQIVETAGALTETLKGIFNTPPGSRPAHAKGILVGELHPDGHRRLAVLGASLQYPFHPHHSALLQLDGDP